MRGDCRYDIFNSVTGCEVKTQNSVCMVAGKPASDVQYEVIRRVKRGKGTYGSPAQILPAFAAQTHALGADAVIDYRAGQRFGFWPWRVVRPVVWGGTAVRWNAGQQIDCQAIGGFEQSTVR